MHEVDDVQGGDILCRQPVHEAVHAGHDGVKIKDFIFDWFSFRANLHTVFLINTTVDCV